LSLFHSLAPLGVWGALSYALARLAALSGIFGYNRYVIVAVPLSGMPKMPRGYTIRSLSIDALADHEIDVSHEVQAARLAQGLTCLGAFNAKNMLVGVNWVGTAPYGEDEVRIRFCVPTGAGWDTGLWIRPQLRLGRGFAALWAGTAEWLKGQSCDWSISRIADYNLPSILSHKRMGGVTVGNVTAIRLGNWQYATRGTPRLVRMSHGRPADIIVQLP
jgi:hypothetical protein